MNDEVAALPQNVRAVVFNVYGEALVYGIDDVVYHSDCDWQEFPVVDGTVPGLVLDTEEQTFVAAMWAISRSWKAQVAGVTDTAEPSA
jgi:hypothetical protein